MSVKSVYNFVPAPKENEVFKPDWADKVSHDIPFEDGESGEIELTITAKTPIFIRNGHSKKDAENDTERYREFSNTVRNGKKEYFIPGSSLKGMFRNVLEIMSFSRIKQIANDRYSFRDLSSAKNLYMTKYKEFKIRGGWLVQDKEGKWKLEECDDLAFIHHKELQKKGIPFRDLFLNKQPEEKTAEYKYEIVKSELLSSKFSTYTKELFGNVSRTMANYDENGKKGVLVFTGQSSKRNEFTDKNGKPKASGKIHEFVFFGSENPTYLGVEDKMQKDFKFIYLDHDKQNVSKDWKFWRENLNKGKKVPVFYAKDNKGKLKHFGLAYMYKLPFEHSIKETLPYKSYDLISKDLSEIIFGDTLKDNALKGRVFVSHAFSENAIEGDTQKEILAGPKASYFPFYIDQENKKNRDKTYMEADAMLRGFKRYPIQNSIHGGSYDSKQKKNDKVFSYFKPLEEGAVFLSKIRFQNLKKVEIGALLSAITFHGNEAKSFHSIGGAKPFGYGQIKLSNISLKGLKHQKEEYLSEFENLMGGDEWLDSEQLVELITMSQQSDASLEYPEEPKTFVDYKKDNLYLKKYTEIVEKPSKVQSIAKQVEINKNIDSFSFVSNNFNKLKAHIKELGYTEVPENLQGHLKDAIVNMYQNDKASMRKLSKPFDKEYMWKSIISGWVGKETAKQWYEELNK